MNNTLKEIDIKVEIEIEIEIEHILAYKQYNLP